MRRNSISVLFFIKKAKLLKNGEASVCMRITVNGVRAETNIRKSIEPALWNQAKECARGRGYKSVELNNYVEQLRMRLHKICAEFEQNNEAVSARILQERLFGVKKRVEPVRTLIKTMCGHNEKCRALIGKDYALSTVRHYDNCARYLEQLLKLKYDVDDIPLSDVNAMLIHDFEFYLKTTKNCCQNTVIRYMKCLKKIINEAIANEWIEKNPFAGIKFHAKEVSRVFLSMEELMTIYRKRFYIPRIELARDIFIFSAFTGLAFIDVKQLSHEHIVQDGKGNLWIRKCRQKTNNMCNIPMLDIPMKILKKYENHPVCQKRGVVLPVPCNQKMNSYLKEIADLCGIEKHLSTHVARHSYATSVCLANGVRLENVAKMLGHSNIKMTQHYAKVLDSSILHDMMNVNRVLETNSQLPEVNR